MTLEESIAEKSIERMQCAGKALEELLVSAQSQECLIVGVYESAKVMNVDLNSVACCVLATDEEYECDIALQIHFTLIQVLISDWLRFWSILMSLANLKMCIALSSRYVSFKHDLIISNPSEDRFEDPALEKLSLFCEECRSFNEWVPAITLPEC
ncbi:UNVERIFIED_CONTAM: hypothetical protein FKN15_041873 [Acipenser sinensis]